MHYTFQKNFFCSNICSLSHQKLSVSKGIVTCLNCGNICSGYSKEKLCNNCIKILQRKVERPSLELLQQQIKELGYRATGRIYSVTDNTIRKWLKSYQT